MVGRKKMMAASPVGTKLLAQCHQLVPVFHSGFLAPAYQRVDGYCRETRRAVSLGIHADQDVRHGFVLFELVHTVEIYNLHQDARRGVKLRGGLQFRRHVDADDDVGTHLTGDVGRKVVAQTTVYQHFAICPDGSKDSGNRHAGTHGSAEHAAVEHHFGIVDHIGGHAGKGNGQRVEVDGIVVGCRQGVKQCGNVPAHDETATVRRRLALAEGELFRDDVGVLLLALMQTLTAQILAVREYERPVLGHEDGVQLVGTVTAGIDTAHDAAHAGTGNDVDGYTGTFQHLQCTHVCRTLGTAATQHQRHLLAACCCLACRLALGARRLFAPRCLCKNHEQRHQYHCYLSHLLQFSAKITINN